MADYQSQHTGPNIDRGVQIALDWDPTIIGCKRVESTMSAPLDLDTFLEPGSWVVDYYVNGPVRLLNYTPLPFSISETYDGATLTQVTQSVDIDQVKAYRNYTVATSTWTAWIEQGFPKIVKSTGTADNVIITDSTVNVSDLMEITVQLNATLNEGATITINGKGPYPIKMPDDSSIPGGIFNTNSFMKFIYSNDASAFYMIATPIPNELAQTLTSYGAKLTSLETAKDSMQETLDDLDERVTKNTEDIAGISGGTGFAHSVDHSQDGQANTPWTKITFNEEGVVTKGEDATASDVKMSSTDETTVAEKIESIEQTVPTEALTASRVIVTDENGKLAVSDIPSEKLGSLIFFEEASVEDLTDLPT